MPTLKQALHPLPQPVRLLSLVLSFLLLITAAVPVFGHSGSQQTKWDYHDDPVHVKLSGRFFIGKGTSGGWGKDYEYTYGIGNSSAPDQKTVWDFGHRHGKQLIFVYVPKAPADVRATVTYRIYKNNTLLESVDVNQQDNKGWVRLGSWQFNGASARIEQWDNETREHYDPNNKAESRIGLDAVATRCVRDCGNDSEPIGSIYPTRDEYIASLDNTSKGNGFLCDLPVGYHPSHTGLIKWDAFEYKGVGMVDPWSFYVGECTSWVAYRLTRAGIPFGNDSGGTLDYQLNPPGKWPCTGAFKWSHAHCWDDRARAWNNSARKASGLDVSVSATPSVGSVAQWDTGEYGHVAYVEAVSNDGSTITISEMNWNNYSSSGRSEWCKHGTRTIHRGANGSWPGGLEFIHFTKL